MSKKILVVDDEAAFLRMLSQILSRKGYEVITATDGREALRRWFTHRPDLLIIDVVVPKFDGWQILGRIREVSSVPIIMLTGKSKSEEDIVRGLDYGADDYLVKPVGSKELLARVQAVLRRSQLPPVPDTAEKISYRDSHLTIDVDSHLVSIAGQRTRLSAKEFCLLSLLLANAGCVLTHKRLLEKVWGWEYTNDIDHLRIYIWHLRRKIEPEPARPRYIITEPGTGYYFQKRD